MPNHGPKSLFTTRFIAINFRWLIHRDDSPDDMPLPWPAIGAGRFEVPVSLSWLGAVESTT
jgi:hypothetical protein